MALPAPRRRWALAAAGALLPLLLLGCTTGSSGSDGAAEVVPVGTWGSAEQGDPHLVLAEDGRVSGSDGCNRLIGSWEFVEGRVELGPLAATLMACEGVDTWLSSAETLDIDGDIMRVLDGQGEELGTLDRQ